MNRKCKDTLEDISILENKNANPNNPPLPSKTVPLHNDETHLLSSITKNVLESTVEAKTGAILVNFQKAVPILLNFKELSHTQT